MKSSMILFTSPTCPHCHHARDVAAEIAKERGDVEYVEHSTVTPQGGRVAKRFNIMSVPTFIIKGEGYIDPIGLAGGQSKSNLNKYIDLSLGIRDVDEPKKGIRDRLKEGFKIGKLRVRL